MNRYDSEHATARHRQMTAEQWESIYKKVWQLYYSWEHIETLLRRAVATGTSSQALALAIFQYYTSPRFERVHPLQAGLFRRKLRNQRRNPLPHENPILFYPNRLKELLASNIPALLVFCKLLMLRRRVERNAKVKAYSDLAIDPVAPIPDEKLDLYEQSEAARRAVAFTRKQVHQAQAVT
jgi:hypothetical protein